MMERIEVQIEVLTGFDQLLIVFERVEMCQKQGLTMKRSQKWSKGHLLPTLPGGRD